MKHKAYKFRIYPTLEQEIVLRKTIGCCRFIYNWGLSKRREAWVAEKKSMTYVKLCKTLTDLKGAPERGWLNDVSAVCLQQSLNNLDLAFANFFKKRTKYPNFKTRKNGGSAKFLENAFKIKEDDLFLAKIKNPIRVIWSRKLNECPSSCTVSQNAAGQWFVSFLCEEEIEKLPENNKRIGLDVGIESFCVTSEGVKFSQPKEIKKLRKKLARLQKLHSRKQKSSRNRERARKKAAKLHQRIKNIRQDFLHKLSTKIIRENQTIALEDLAVSNMVKNRHLSRAISEQGWRDFRTMIEYKCEWYGRQLLIVDRFYPSSKTCSCCGAKASFGLKIRQWTCDRCGTNHDRDVNAAKNILAAGQAVSDSGADGRPIKNYILKGIRQRKSKFGAKA